MAFVSALAVRPVCWHGGWTGSVMREPGGTAGCHELLKSPAEIELLLRQAAREPRLRCGSPLAIQRYPLHQYSCPVQPVPEPVRLDVLARGYALPGATA